MTWRYYIPHVWDPLEERTKRESKRRRSQLAWLGRDDYRLDRDKMDLTVRAADFSKAECLARVERWLADTFTCSGLVAATLDDFAGRSSMADTIIAIRDRAGAVDR